MEADKWLTLPDDLLVDIFRRLEATAIIGCAGACQPWRRTIIRNALRFRPRQDRFLPDLLLGFLDQNTRFPWLLQYVPGSNTEVPSLFTPATSVGVSIDGRLYNNLLSSRDGLLLLGENTGHQSLCLCTAVTGACKVVPAAALFDSSNSVECMYVLATGYDMHDVSASNGCDEAEVWILAVKWLGNSKNGIIYQILSSKSGAWGAVKCSEKFPEDVARAYTRPCSSRGRVVVCRGAVSWFVDLFPYLDDPTMAFRWCVFSVDLRTARTWTTEIPIPSSSSRVLAVSEDRHLSIAQMLPYSHRIEVWVLVGDDGQWTLRRTIDDVQKLLPNCPSMSYIGLVGFCPRSGFLFGTGRGDNRDLIHNFIIGTDGSSPRQTGTVESKNSPHRFPYERDWYAYMSSFISKMKYF